MATKNYQDFIDFVNILKKYYGVYKNQGEFVALLFEKISNAYDGELISDDPGTLGSYLSKRSIYPNVSTVLLASLNRRKFKKWIESNVVTYDAITILLRELTNFVKERIRFRPKDKKAILKLCSIETAGEFTYEIFINILSAPDSTNGRDSVYITEHSKMAVQQFIGRTTELDDIKELLDTEEPQRIWIHGMGGLGKTQLCRKLFADLVGISPFLGWVIFDGNLKQSLVNQVICEKNTTDIEKAYQDTIKFINGKRTNLVLCIDNTDKAGSSLTDLEKLNCHVIVTSRNAAPDTFTEKALGFLSLTECKKLFYNYYKRKKDDLVNEVIHRAGYLTLAVELLAKTAAAIDVSIDELHAKLIEKSFDLRTAVETNWDNDEEAQNKAVSVQFGIVFSFSGIKDDADKIYVLKNMSILPYLATRQKLLCEWLGLDDESSVFRNLYDSGWLQYSEEDGYLMHPVISYTVRTELVPLLNSCLNLIESLIDAIESKGAKSIYDVWEFVPYAQTAADYFIGNFEYIDPNNSLYMVALCLQLADLFYKNFDHDIAFRYGKASQSVAESFNSMKFAVLAKIYRFLAAICVGIPEMKDDGLQYAELAVKYADSIDINKEDSENQQGALLISDTYIQLAASLGQYGEDFSRALTLANAALKICEGPPPDPLRLEYIYRTIAFILIKKGDLIGAGEYMERCVDIIDDLRSINPNHPDIANTYTVYAGFLLNNDERLDDAIAYLKKSVTIRKRNDPDDCFIAQNFHNIAVAYFRKNDLTSTCKYLFLAINEYERNDKSLSLEKANLYFKLARVQYIAGDYNGALVSTRKSMSVKTTILDELNCHCHIAMCYYSNGENEAAKQEIEKVINFNKANSLKIDKGITCTDDGNIMVECYLNSTWPYDYEIDYATCMQIYKEITENVTIDKE